MGWTVWTNVCALQEGKILPVQVESIDAESGEATVRFSSGATGTLSPERWHKTAELAMWAAKAHREREANQLEEEVDRLRGLEFEVAPWSCQESLDEDDGEAGDE